MSVFKFGPLIRQRREELGYTQEDVADGICAVTTLSRIENGERVPTQNHLELLLQRIGYSDMMLASYSDANDFRAHELKFQIRQANIEGNQDKAKALLTEFEQLLRKPTQMDKQFVLLQKVLLYQEQYSNGEQLQKLEEAMRLTHPNYRRDRIPCLLSYEEIILLNNIAARCAAGGHRKEGIDILYGVVHYYDTHIVNIEEALRTEPMTLYNLSKFLGLENRFDECIDICDKGIQLAQKTGRSSCFGQTLYNKAWALVKRNHQGDMSEAKELAQRALNVAIAFENAHFAEHCQRFIQTYWRT